MANARPAYHLKQEPGGGAYRSRCRQVATFNGVSQYVSIPTVTLSGDFEVEITVKLPVLNTQNLKILSNTSNNSALSWDGTSSGVPSSILLQTLSTGWIKVADYPHTLETTKFIISRMSDVVTVLANGKDISTGATVIGDFAFSWIGHWHNEYAYSAISNLKIWDGGDRNTGTLIRDYPIDDGYANNPVIRDIASNQDGVMINGTEAMWSERCDL